MLIAQCISLMPLYIILQNWNVRNSSSQRELKSVKIAIVGSWIFHLTSKAKINVFLAVFSKSLGLFQNNNKNLRHSWLPKHCLLLPAENFPWEVCFFSNLRSIFGLITYRHSVWCTALSSISRIRSIIYDYVKCRENFVLAFILVMNI